MFSKTPNDATALDQPKTEISFPPLFGECSKDEQSDAVKLLTREVYIQVHLPFFFSDQNKQRKSLLKTICDKKSKEISESISNLIFFGSIPFEPHDRDLDYDLKWYVDYKDKTASSAPLLSTSWTKIQGLSFLPYTLSWGSL